MKKFSLIILLSLQSLCFGQIDWLPLQIDNEYQYNLDHQNYYFETITKDTVVNGKIYYHFQECFPIAGNIYLREDSLGNIYTLNSSFYIDTIYYIEQPEYLLFPYDCKGGDRWLVARHKSNPDLDRYGECEWTDSTIVNGKVQHIRSTALIVSLPFSYVFAEGVGIVEWDYENAQYKLNYAKIGKETYGTLVGVNDKKPVPEEYMLLQNYPNPFNPNTTISYSLAKSCPVTLKIYDLLGNEVKTLVNEYKPAGSYNVNFDASKLSSGVYIYRIIAGSYTSYRKMLLVK